MKSRILKTPASRRNPRGQRMLNVKMRAATAKRKRQQLLMGFSMAVIGLSLFCGLAWFGISRTLDKFFFSNPAYNLADLELELDGILTPEDFREETGILEGENIFKLDIDEADRRLRAIPMVADVAIERVLPDRMHIVLQAREPVAWVSSSNDPTAPYDVSSMLLVDASGFLMRPRLIPQEFHSLPVIYGVNATDILEGKPLQNDDLKKAIALLDEVSARPESLVRIRSLNISKGYCIDALTDQNARVKFGRSDFSGQIEKLHRLLVHCRDTGREIDSVNLMVSKNTPVKFVMASLSPPAKGGATATKSKQKN
jgi:cell division septal protein FtsQ